MNKTELIAEVAEKANLSKKDAEAAVKAFIDSLTGALVEGDKVQLVGFGTFEVRERAARFGRDPRTGESMEIAEMRSVFVWECPPARVKGKPCPQALLFFWNTHSCRTHARGGLPRDASVFAAAGVSRYERERKPVGFSAGLFYADLAGFFLR